MSLPSMNFLHLTVSEIQAGLSLAARLTDARPPIRTPWVKTITRRPLRAVGSKLDCADLTPKYPQTGHLSYHRQSLDILCSTDFVWFTIIITRLSFFLFFFFFFLGGGGGGGGGGGSQTIISYFLVNLSSMIIWDIEGKRLTERCRYLSQYTGQILGPYSTTIPR